MDIIIALTEGLVADIAKGSDLQLLGTYVVSDYDIDFFFKCGDVDVFFCFFFSLLALCRLHHSAGPSLVARSLDSTVSAICR